MPISRSLFPFCALAAVFCLASSPAFAGDRSVVSIEARQWSAEPSGRLSVIGGDLSETLDFRSDLGLEEDATLEGRLTFRPSRRTMVRLGFFPELEIAGDNVVTRPLTFLGQSFSLSERVVTNLTLEYGRLAFAWMFLSASEGRVRLGPLIEAKGFRGDLSLTAPDSPVPLMATDRYEVAFGAAGLVAEVELSERVELFGESTEVVTGDEGDVTETEYGVRVRVLPKLSVVAGSRTLEIDFTDRDDRFTFELDGVFVAARASF